MQENTYETPLNEYLYDGEYFLWVGKGRTNFECPRSIAIFWLIFTGIFTILIIIVSICKNEFHVSILGIIPLAVVGVFFYRDGVNTPADEHYAVTNIRVMRLIDTSFVFEHISNIYDVKIYPAVKKEYTNIHFLSGVTNNFYMEWGWRCDRHFNRLEKAEAEYVKKLIISQRDKLNNK